MAASLGQVGTGRCTAPSQRRTKPARHCALWQHPAALWEDASAPAWCPHASGHRSQPRMSPSPLGAEVGQPWAQTGPCGGSWGGLVAAGPRGNGVGQGPGAGAECCGWSASHPLVSPHTALLARGAATTGNGAPKAGWGAGHSTRGDADGPEQQQQGSAGCWGGSAGSPGAEEGRGGGGVCLGRRAVFAHRHLCTRSWDRARCQVISALIPGGSGRAGRAGGCAAVHVGDSGASRSGVTPWGCGVAQPCGRHCAPAHPKGFGVPACPGRGSPAPHQHPAGQPMASSAADSEFVCLQPSWAGSLAARAGLGFWSEAAALRRALGPARGARQGGRVFGAAAWGGAGVGARLPATCALRGGGCRYQHPQPGCQHGRWHKIQQKTVRNTTNF